eukprot:758319-Hanusia_phi.AAC.6
MLGELKCIFLQMTYAAEQKQSAVLSFLLEVHCSLQGKANITSHGKQGCQVQFAHLEVNGLAEKHKDHHGTLPLARPVFEPQVTATALLMLLTSAEQGGTYGPEAAVSISLTCSTPGAQVGSSDVRGWLMTPSEDLLHSRWFDPDTFKRELGQVVD